LDSDTESNRVEQIFGGVSKISIDMMVGRSLKKFAPMSENIRTKWELWQSHHETKVQNLHLGRKIIHIRIAESVYHLDDGYA
jgi:hypothetical protein